MSSYAESTLRGLPTGERVEGYAVAVVNEHAVRFAARVLFGIGLIGWSVAITTSDFSTARLFAVIFLFEMGIRLGVGARLAPLYALGLWVNRRREPLWVGAPQKSFAWGLGFVLSISACFSFGWLGLPALALAICAVCLVFLGAEALFGWCVGCAIYRRFWPDKTFYCADGSCEVAASNYE
jgi:hypothetical protein